MAQTKQPQAAHRETTAADFIFQWLSYAFWGWLTIAVLWLVGITLSYLLTGASTGSVVPYSIAAILVLLPFTFVVDLFYRRREDLKKKGAASVLMVVHAVLFAITAIGTLIGAVFMGLGMLLGDIDGSGSGQIVALCVMITAAVLFGVLFVRVTNPFKTQSYAKFYALGVLGVTIVLIIAAIAGPAVRSFQLRDDKRIETNLYSVQEAINSHIEENNALPGSLNSLRFYSDRAEELVEDGAVRYKKDTSVATETATEYRYQLCVTYTDEARGEYTPYNSYNEYDDDPTVSAGYRENLSVSTHPAGDVCYKLKYRVPLER